MKRGYLVSFEGLDGTGKTSLMEALAAELSMRGSETTLVPEFSSDGLGVLLQDMLKSNKFLRMSTNNPSAFTETLYLIADLYQKDESLIKPGIRSGNIVLADRYTDSIFACQIPKIQKDYPELSQQELWKWLSHSLDRLTSPNLTIMLTMDSNERTKRLKLRGDQLTDSDLVIENERKRIFTECLKSAPERFLDFNYRKSVRESAYELADRVLERFP